MDDLSPEEMNTKMVALCPELGSEYAKYPLKGKQWLSPKAKVSGDEYAFIASETDNGPKPDYVYGTGSFGRGYYHILTRQAYKVLYGRLTRERPPLTCCLCSSAAARQNSIDWEHVKTLCFNRSVATIPDDDQARKDAIVAAQGMAQAHYHEQQNIQLVYDGLGSPLAAGAAL